VTSCLGLHARVGGDFPKTRRKDRANNASRDLPVGGARSLGKRAAAGAGECAESFFWGRCTSWELP